MGDHTVQRKARVFVGSSSEAREQVQIFCDVLRDDAEMMPWWIAPEFEPGFFTMETLLLAVDSYDYGIFILTPDDSIESKGEKSKAARDNVLLEYGLFLATLGRKRTFALIQESQSDEKQVKLPSDLLGITIPRFSFRDRRDLLASANTAVSKIRDSIKTGGRKHIKVDVIDSYAAHRESFSVTITLSAHKVTRHIARLQNHLFAIVLVKTGGYGHTYDEKDTVAGEPVFISEYLSRDLTLAATNAEFFERTQPGDVVRVYLVMVEEYDRQLLRGGTSIKDMTTTGVYVLQDVDIAIVG